MPALHKNIIPQDMAELRQLQHSFADFRVNDVVNARPERQSAAVRLGGAEAVYTAAGDEAATGASVRGERRAVRAA
jgi:hypothetical protein